MYITNGADTLESGREAIYHMKTAILRSLIICDVSHCFMIRLFAFVYRYIINESIRFSLIYPYTEI